MFPHALLGSNPSPTVTAWHNGLWKNCIQYPEQLHWLHAFSLPCQLTCISSNSEKEGQNQKLGLCSQFLHEISVTWCLYNSNLWALSSSTQHIIQELLRQSQVLHWGAIPWWQRTRILMSWLFIEWLCLKTGWQTLTDQHQIYSNPRSDVGLSPCSSIVPVLK